MLNNNIIKEKSDLYYTNNLKQFYSGENEEKEKEKFYDLVNSIFQKVLTDNHSDFSEEELDMMDRYHLNMEDLLDYLKTDIKTMLVESGKRT